MTGGGSACGADGMEPSALMEGGQDDGVSAKDKVLGGPGRNIRKTSEDQLKGGLAAGLAASPLTGDGRRRTEDSRRWLGAFGADGRPKTEDGRRKY